MVVIMRIFETNDALEDVGHNDLEILYEPEVLNEDELEIPLEVPKTVPSQKSRKEKKNGNSTFNDIGYYFDQLKKMSKDFLSHEEIKRIFETVKKHERAILSIFYYMDSFFEGLNEIRDTFEIKEATHTNTSSNNKSKNGTIYTKEQFRLITKISRKALGKNEDKEKEISRVKVILEKICPNKENTSSSRVIFQRLFEKLPFKNNSYADFIAYFDKMVERIEANKWGEKTERVAVALEKYSGVNYNNIRDVFTFFNEVTQLNFENKYYYQKSYLSLKKKIQEVDQLKLDDYICKQEKAGLERIIGLNYDLILKSIGYVERYENKIKKLLNDFSERYFCYVVFVAKRFINGKLSFSDIIQEGNLGLLKAVKKYNYELGHKFITYAFYWIRQGIVRAIADQSRTIRIPIHVYQEYSNIKKIERHHKMDLVKDLDLKYISTRTGKSEEEINTLFKLFETPMSLTQEIKGDSGNTLSSFIPDIKAIDPSIIQEKETLKDEIYFHLRSLTEREAKLIEMRFGLKDGIEYTLDEIAREFKLTRERIRQIEVKALNRLKRKGKQRLKPYLAHNYEDVDYCSI
jgi:RNA polymerase sigma factor (sigma-70 family)